MKTLTIQVEDDLYWAVKKAAAVARQNLSDYCADSLATTTEMPVLEADYLGEDGEGEQDDAAVGE